jgi:hypothetical protein
LFSAIDIEYFYFFILVSVFYDVKASAEQLRDAVLGKSQQIPTLPPFA